MIRRSLLTALFLLCISSPAWALNCSSNPFTLTEGTTALATQVMANFNNLLTCANTVLGKFTGPAVSVDGDPVCFSGTAGQTGKACDNWTAYNPTFTCGTGALGAFVWAAAHKAIVNTVFFTVTLSITANDTCAGNIVVTLPFTAAATYNFVVTGRNAAPNPVSGNCGLGAGGTTMTCYKYDGTYPGGTGEVLVWSGFFRK